MQKISFKIFAINMIVISTFMFSFVHADEINFTPDNPIKVETPNLKLVGSGMMNRKTKEFVSVACVGQPNPDTQEPTCKQLRNVYLSSNKKEAYFFGPTYDVTTNENSGNPSNTEIKNKLKEIYHHYKALKRDRRKNQKNEQAVQYITGAAMVVGAFVGANNPADLVVGEVFVGIALVFVLGRWYISSTHAISGGKISNALQDQNGWNWSSKIWKVKSKNFDTYIDSVLENTNTLLNFRTAP